MNVDELDRPSARSRLAIIGGGSSGLISLKTALDELPDWEIMCLEKTPHITGCWGNPHREFVSTSTKYTTQFACFPERDATLEPDEGRSQSEFFRGAEYGEYLQRFADAFDLHPHIKLQHQVERLARAPQGDGWSVSYRRTAASDPSAVVTEHFDAVLICSGLTAQCVEMDSPVPALSPGVLSAGEGMATVRNQRVVVFGGGESAVDFASRLARPELANQVYLSLRTGMRVSPRYHPIRGVPSDFLRNRLMLSIHPTLRNWIGQWFVEARILHQERFQKWFPSSRSRDIVAKDSGAETLGPSQAHQSLRKEWDYRLTKAAKADLFNMFHNKSDDFLDMVASGQITILGAPVDSRMERFHQFESQEVVDVHPTRILPAIGYRSTLGAMTGNAVELTDFYLGCCHVRFTDLFLVGFARPVIGNIPTISEMQARYVCGLIAGRYGRPSRIAELNAMDQQRNAARFATLDLHAVYPVEMFSYCDRLARLMGTYPSLRRIGSIRQWLRMQLAPAVTMHYGYHVPEIRRVCERAPVYMPPLIILLLLLIVPVDGAFRAAQRLMRRRSDFANDVYPTAR